MAGSANVQRHRGPGLARRWRGLSRRTWHRSLMRRKSRARCAFSTAVRGGLARRAWAYGVSDRVPPNAPAGAVLPPDPGDPEAREAVDRVSRAASRRVGFTECEQYHGLIVSGLTRCGGCAKQAQAWPGLGKIAPCAQFAFSYFWAIRGAEWEGKKNIRIGWDSNPRILGRYPLDQHL